MEIQSISNGSWPCHLARALGLAGGPYPVICRSLGNGGCRVEQLLSPWSTRRCRFNFGLLWTIHFNKCLWLCTHAHKEIASLDPSAFRFLELPSFEHWEVSVSACTLGFLPNFCLQTVLIWCLSFCLHHCGFGTSTVHFFARPKDSCWRLLALAGLLDYLWH